MFTWHVLHAASGRIETVDSWPDLEAVLAELATSSWEEPSNAWLSYIVDESGLVVATALFGPDLELLVACADGRRMTFPMPEAYRERQHDGQVRDGAA